MINVSSEKQSKTKASVHLGLAIALSATTPKLDGIYLALTLTIIAILVISSFILYFHGLSKSGFWQRAVKICLNINVGHTAFGFGLAGAGISLLQFKIFIFGIPMILAGALILGIGIAVNINNKKRATRPEESQTGKEEKILSSATKIQREESAKYLLSEYEQCFIQMRHYNDNIISLSKFIFSILAALISGAFALLQYLSGETYQNAVIGSIFILALIIGLAFLGLMVRNRLYFIIVARQVNSLRNYFLNNMELDYLKYNICYTDPNLPKALNPWSIYTIMFWMLSLVNGFLATCSFYFLANYFTSWNNWILSITIGIVVTIIQILLICISLVKYDAVKPNNIN